MVGSLTLSPVANLLPSPPVKQNFENRSSSRRRGAWTEWHQFFSLAACTFRAVLRTADCIVTATSSRPRDRRRSSAVSTCSPPSETSTPSARRPTRSVAGDHVTGSPRRRRRRPTGGCRLAGSRWRSRSPAALKACSSPVSYAFSFRIVPLFATSADKKMKKVI